MKRCTSRSYHSERQEVAGEGVRDVSERDSSASAECRGSIRHLSEVVVWDSCLHKDAGEDDEPEGAEHHGAQGKVKDLRTFRDGRRMEEYDADPKKR